jgi:hypothetical protein
VQAAEALEKSKVLYKSGERMQALKLLETLDLEVRRVNLYCPLLSSPNSRGDKSP